MRIGLIGCGRIGAFHARTLADLMVVDELVVTDAYADLATHVATEIGGTAVADPGALLAAGVDGVVIASSTSTHPDMLRACVEAGLPTFCEKPVAPTAKEALSIRDELAGSDVPVQIGFPRRFDRGYVAARDALQSGRLGYLHTIRSTTLDMTPPPEAYIAGSGGIFHDCAVHDYDSVRWATGQEVVEVFATGAARGVDYISAAGDVETGASVLTLSDGTIALVSSTRVNGGGYDVRLELMGSEGAIAAGLDERLPMRSADTDLAFPGDAPWESFMDRLADAFRAELAAFTDVVAGTIPSPCTVADAVEASLIAEACTISWRADRPVRLEEVR